MDIKSSCFYDINPVGMGMLPKIKIPQEKIASGTVNTSEANEVNRNELFTCINDVFQVID